MKIKEFVDCLVVKLDHEFIGRLFRRLRDDKTVYNSDTAKTIWSQLDNMYLELKNKNYKRFKHLCKILCSDSAQLSFPDDVKL